MEAESQGEIKRPGLLSCWFFATLVASLIIFTGIGILEGEPATAVFGLFAMPFALIVTSPSLLVWAIFLEGKSRSRFVFSGAIFALFVTGLMELDHVLRATPEDLFLLCLSGVAGAVGGLVWHFFENLEYIR